MKKILKPETTKPQYVVTTDITYAQVDSWFGHCRRDLKLDLIYPEDGEGRHIHVLYGFAVAHGSAWTKQRIWHIWAHWRRKGLLLPA